MGWWRFPSCVDGLGTDLVYTHVDRTGVVARTVTTARLLLRPVEIATPHECRGGH